MAGRASPANCRCASPPDADAQHATRNRQHVLSAFGVVGPGAPLLFFILPSSFCLFPAIPAIFRLYSAKRPASLLLACCLGGGRQPLRYLNLKRRVAGS